MDEARSTRTTEIRRLILNPVSGQADHVDLVGRLAAIHQFVVVENERRGHATELAKQAVADDVDLLAVCGGDGTVHEVVHGLSAANALDSLTLCVIPAGTENIIAGELGIEDLSDGFEIADHGETRQLDLGLVNNEPFVMSAVAGLPADVSDATTSALKHRFGSFAFVVGGLKEGLTFDGLDVTLDADSHGVDTAWTGEAIAVLVGNLRQFSTAGGQANAEDGLLEVDIIEHVPPSDIIRETIEQRFLGRETSYTRTLKATQLEITHRVETSIRFSLDGEIREFETAQFGILPQSLRIRVGTTYTPNS